MEFKQFETRYIEDAAKLFAQRYKLEREYTHFLPERYEDHNTISLLLNDQIDKSPGVVAINKGKLSGYLIGRLLSLWRGRRSVFVPFWAHSVEGEDRKAIYQQMYTYLASKWITNGCFTHLISVLAHDEELLDTLFSLGFGTAVDDAMRDSSEIQAPGAQIEIKTATLSDLDTVVSLDHELARYLAGPPIFMPMVEKRGRQYHEKWLSNPLHTLWLASDNGKVISYLKICPVDDDAVISDDKTIWIQGAYTKENMRLRGIGTALLKQAIKWVQSRNYKRCAVDFESENVLAGTFWLSHFKPVCYSLVRHIDKRIAWADTDRDDKDFW